LTSDLVEALLAGPSTVSRTKSANKLLYVVFSRCYCRRSESLVVRRL
jgi:hypothetical protein